MSRVVRDAPAARAGLRPGDVITSIDNRDIPTAAELAGHHLGAARSARAS